MRVTVGNGAKLQCGGTCMQAPLQMNNAVFPVNLILLPVFGVNIVLGVHWLAKLGLTIFDYQQLWWTSIIGHPRSASWHEDS